MRIGVLGGTFNPIHNGHLILGEQMRERLDLERLLFVPARMPPHKNDHDLAPAADRLEMVRLAVNGNNTFEVSDIEIHREGCSYTIDTIAELRRTYGPRCDLFFVIGSDTVQELPTWHRIGELLLMCKFVVGARPGYEPNVRKHLSHILPEAELKAMESRIIQIRLIEISATEVRSLVNTNGSIRYLVPRPVEDYIRKHALYV